MSTSSMITVAILCFINLINYMDRFTVAGVLRDVKGYYSLTDSEAGLLQTSFIVSYMIMAPIFGYLGDRYSRRNIISLGVLFWSLTTFLGSLIPASSTGWFFFMRALVGTGEASYSTIAPTIIADLFANELRTKMLAVFFFAIPVGSGLGYVVGSQVATALGKWQWALRVTPPLGVLSVVLVMFFLKDPPRGQSDGAMHFEKTTVLSDLKYMLTVKSYIWSTLGFTCVCFAIGALSWWAPLYMTYAYNVVDSKITEDEVGLIFGIITCFGGILGVLLGSGGAQWYRKKNPRADPLICGIAVLLSVPFVFLGVVIAHKSPISTWIFIFVGITFLCINWTLVTDMLLYVIVPNRRSLAQAMQILASHLLGDACSPFIVGLLSDSLRDRETDIAKYTSLQYGLYSTCFVLVLGGIAFLYTAYFIAEDKELCKIKTQGHRLSDSDDTSIHSLPPNGSAVSSPEMLESLQSFPPPNCFLDSDRNLLLPVDF